MATKRTIPGVFALPTDLLVDLRLSRSGVSLTLHGEIDVHTAPVLRERLQDALAEQEEQVVVHLDDVTFIDSTGLGVLVGAHNAQTAAGGRFEIVCTEPRLLRILSLTGLHALFSIHDGSPEDRS